MVLVKENFIVRNTSSINMKVNASLPFRLQKRQLLRKLGFPGNPDLFPCQARDQDKIKHLLSRFSHEVPFLIVVSKKPRQGKVTPLFRIGEEKSVLYRDEFNNQKEISLDKIQDIIGTYPPNSWVEFTHFKWNPSIIAGRLLYKNFFSQFPEIQKGVEPHQLGCFKGSPYFCCELHDFNARDKFSDNLKHLQSLGYKCFRYKRVRLICKALSRFRDGFQVLEQVSPLPTLEFAYKSFKNWFIIDIDWPGQ